MWGIFTIVFLIHLFLAKEWFDGHFVGPFLNSGAFLGAVSQAYQKVVTRQCGCFDFSIFLKCSTGGVGKYWPSLPSMVYLWTLLALSFRWLFLPNLLYLAAIMLGIYLSAKELCGNAFYSMLAAVIFSCYWMVDIQLVACEVQLAATACIAWGFYAYLRSQHFTKLWPTVFMSIFTIMALYCDRLSPGLFLFALFLVPRNFKCKRSMILMAFALILIVVCAWPFYYRWIRKHMNAPAFAFKFNDLQDGPPLPPAEIYRVVLHNPLFLFSHLSFYFISLTERLLGYGFTALLTLGVVFFRRLNKLKATTLWIATGIPLTAFILVAKKDPVYIFPLCIYFAMITSIGISFIRQRVARSILIGLIAGLTVVQYCFLFRIHNPYSTGYFSHRFKAIHAQGVPRIFWRAGGLSKEDFIKDIYSIVGQVKNLLPETFVSGMNSPKLIVDLRENNLQSSVLFFLNLFFPKVEVIDGRREKVLSPNPSRETLYLLSNKREYEETDFPKSAAGCSWKSLEAEHRLADSDVVLYQLTP